MATDLEKEYNYYLENRESLIKMYLGRHIIIKDETVMGDFSSELEAYEYGKVEFGLGNFLIQHCVPGDDNVKNTFHSRVEFA